jgi:hypothetical protein
MTDVPVTSTPAPAPAGSRGRLRALWNGAVAVIGGVVGLVPHVLHHVGLVAGAALVTGAKGNAVFAVLGLLASLPLLRRLHRRFGTWRAPALALAAFAVMFSLSAFVIGPAISGSGDVPNDVDPVVEPSHDDQHHES